MIKSTKMADIYEMFKQLVSNQIEHQKAQEARDKDKDASIKLLTDQLRLLTEGRQNGTSGGSS